MNSRQVLRLRPLHVFQQFWKQPSRTESNTSTFPEIEVTALEKCINRACLMGRAGGEPQKRGTDQHPVVIFSLATHVNHKDSESGKVIQKTEWHRVCVFQPPLRDLVYQFLHKGQRVYVEGRITYGEIKGEDGTPKATTVIAASDVIFLQSSVKTR